MCFLFLGMQLLKQSPSNRDQGLHKIYKHGSLSLVLKPCPGMRYERGLLKSMFDRAYRLSSCRSYFSKQCDRLNHCPPDLNIRNKLSTLSSRFLLLERSKTRNQYVKYVPPGDSPTVRIGLGSTLTRTTQTTQLKT